MSFFTVPKTHQQELIYEFWDEDHKPAPILFSWEDLSNPQDIAYLWVCDVPDVGRVLFGSDSAGRLDESIVPSTATRDQIKAELASLQVA